MADQTNRDELNRLYWKSDESVSEIAGRLDISRRALYDSIDPLPADTACPYCGGALEFRNRTNAENRVADCHECGTEVQLDELGYEPEPQVEQERAAAPLSPTHRAPAAWSRGASVPGSGVTMGAALLTGMGLGAAVAYLFHRV